MESTHKLSILIVDDSDLIINRLMEMLSGLEEVSKVVSAEDYESAVHQLNASTVHVALLDIHLPGKNGIELLRYIGQRYPGVQSIMLTNMTSSHHKKACAEAGAVHFIDKSKAFEQIPEILRNIKPGLS